jgi:hypothetical protein
LGYSNASRVAGAYGAIINRRISAIGDEGPLAAWIGLGFAAFGDGPEQIVTGGAILELQNVFFVRVRVEKKFGEGVAAPDIGALEVVPSLDDSVGVTAGPEG